MGAAVGLAVGVGEGRAAGPGAGVGDEVDGATAVGVAGGRAGGAVAAGAGGVDACVEAMGSVGVGAAGATGAGGFLGPTAGVAAGREAGAGRPVGLLAAVGVRRSSTDAAAELGLEVLARWAGRGVGVKYRRGAASVGVGGIRPTCSQPTDSSSNPRASAPARYGKRRAGVLTTDSLPGDLRGPTFASQPGLIGDMLTQEHRDCKRRRPGAGPSARWT